MHWIILIPSYCTQINGRIKMEYKILKSLKLKI
nr:MAG TPA: hypothetical protein [Caudoviricetes sp.]